MNYLDFIILFIVFLGFLLGFKDGLVRKIIGLVGFIAAIFFVFEFSKPAGQFMSSFFNDELYLAEIVAGAAIFFLTILIVAIIKRIVHPVDKVNKFVNQILGGIAGSLQIIIIMSAAFLFLNILKVPSTEVKKNSLFYSEIFNIIPKSVEFILGEKSRTGYFLNEIISTHDLIISDSTTQNKQKKKLNDKQ